METGLNVVQYVTASVCAVIADQDDHIVHTGISSTISMTIGLLALVACIILVIILVRCALLRSCNTHHD